MALAQFAILAALVLPQSATSSADGTALLQADHLSEARDAFENALRSNPSDKAAQDGEVAASERLALKERAASHREEAIQTLLRARDRVPQNAHLLYDLGILEDEMHLLQDADTSLAESDRIAPGNPSTIYGIARVKLDLGQLTAAEEKMKTYLALRPNDATAHFGLGRIYQMGLQPEKAKTEFQKSAELRPVQTEAYFELGDLALKSNNFDEAIANFGKTLERDPKHGGALEGTGEAYFRKKDFEKAEEYLERATAAAPDFSPSHYYLGLTLEKAGHKEEGQKELDVAAKLASNQHAPHPSAQQETSPAVPQR